jgi:hypothetical protein
MKYKLKREKSQAILILKARRLLNRIVMNQMRRRKLAKKDQDRLSSRIIKN